MKFLSLILFVFLGIQVIAQAPPPPPPPPPGVDAPRDTTKQEVYQFAEEMPRFPGPENAFAQYLQQNIHYPDSALKYGREGTVYVSFVVGKDGSIKDVKCMRGVPNAPDLCEEAIRVISIMPNWTPGKMQGKPVRVQMTVPVRFMLQ